MKYIHIILISIISLNSYSQIEGEATYLVVRNFNYDSLLRTITDESKLKYIEHSRNIDKAINNQRFKLRFKDNMSHMFLEEKLESDNKRDHLKFIRSIYPENYFDLITKKNYYVKKSYNKNGYLVESDNCEEETIIHSSENKTTINGFVCNKATVTYINDNEKYTYNVWFSQDINLPFGPFTYNGLPGLVIQVKEPDGTIIQLKKLKLSNQKNIEIPDNYDLISQADFDKMVKDMYNKMR